MLGLRIMLIFGLGGILNQAPGVFSVIALIVTFESTESFPLVFAAAVAIVGVAITGLILERTLRRHRRQSGRRSVWSPRWC